MRSGSRAAKGRRAFVATLVGGVLLARRRVEAQPAARIARIGFLTPSSVSPRGVLRDLRQKLGELGYVEGRDIVFEIRAANEDFERLPELAADLVRVNVDVIVAVSPPAIRAAEIATTTIPIVMAFSGTDPVASVFVASLDRPEGNVTGLTTYTPELAAKRLEVLKACLPGLRRVAILANLRNPTSAAEAREAEAAARPLGLEIQVADARLPEQYPDAFAGIVKGGSRAVFVTADPVISGNQGRIVQLAARYRLPAMYEWHEIVEDGGLMSYGPNRVELSRRVAVYVDRILKGAKPADLPVERATKFELAVNLKTAAALGLAIPPSVLARADRVIK
jgi:putative tryptophan/tyrosine transport system substrate-binding protein